MPLGHGDPRDARRGEAPVEGARRPTRRPQPDTKVERGFVISQAPPAGNHVHKGDTVELVVSTGKPQVEVPEVIGFTQDAALADAERART